jgi:hypothetical protein
MQGTLQQTVGRASRRIGSILGRRLNSSLRALGLLLAIAPVAGAQLADQASVGAPPGWSDQPQSQAADAGAREGRPTFSLDGFGTIGATRSSERDADFVVNPRRPDGPGSTREWSAEVDSRIGLQLTADLTRRLSAVVQLIVEQQYDDDVRPTVEWANLRFEVSDHLSLRVGRTALPTFLSSDYRKVGYANPWVRPPVELYGLVPLFNSDGVDLVYRRRLGRWTQTLQAIYGRSDVELPGSDPEPRGARAETPEPGPAPAGGRPEAEIRDLVGIFDSFERGALTLRGGLATANVTIAALQPLFDGFRMFGPEGAAIAERFEVDGKRVDLASIAASYDPGRWFVISELGRIRTRSAIGHRSGGYLTGGYRWRSLTFLVTYSEASGGDNSSPGLSLAGAPPAAAAQAAALDAILDQVLARIAVQSSLSLGLRWDLRRNVALKLQVDRVRAGAGSYGTFVNFQAGFEPGAETTLITLDTDFVF